MTKYSKELENDIIRSTYSVCPVCLRKVPAVLERESAVGNGPESAVGNGPESAVGNGPESALGDGSGSVFGDGPGSMSGDGSGSVSEDRSESTHGKIRLRKKCPEHGEFATVVWKGAFDFEDWIKFEDPMTESESEQCSGECRSCSGHGQGSCCAILEVTKACNLHCPYCFAYGGDSGEWKTFEELCADIDVIAQKGNGPLIQLSGGEPTLRDDLPDLIRYSLEAGCSYTQINSNGIRLAEDEEYVKKLAEAGLDIVFLQFDGTTDDVFRALRGRDLLSVKLKAIENCDQYGLGVTLVPTIVRGINDHQIGDIIRIGAELFPAVRCVHFQPVTYLGRMPENARDLMADHENKGCSGWENKFTLDELMRALVDQTGIPENSLLPSRCDHAACEFHSTFMVNDQHQLLPLSDRANDNRKCRTSAESNRKYVAEHWRRPEKNQKAESIDTGSEANENSAADADRNADREHAANVGHSASTRVETDREHAKASDQLNAAALDASTIEKLPGAFDPEKPLVADNRDTLDFDTFILYMRTRIFKISAMAFQDAMDIDLERLSRCSLHVYENGKLLPFCGKYLTPVK